jgi:hypothetical protein
MKTSFLRWEYSQFSEYVYIKYTSANAHDQN